MWTTGRTARRIAALMRRAFCSRLRESRLGNDQRGWGRGGKTDDPPPRWVLIALVLGVIAGALAADPPAEAGVVAIAPPVPAIGSTEVRENAVSNPGPRRTHNGWSIPSTAQADRLPDRLDVIVLARGITLGDGRPGYENKAYGAWLGDTGYAVCAFHQIRGVRDPLFAGEASGETEPVELFVVAIDPLRDLALLADRPEPPDPHGLRGLRIVPSPGLDGLVASYPGPRPPNGGAAGSAGWDPSWAMVTRSPLIPRGTRGIVWTTELSTEGMSGSPVYDAATNRPFGLISAGGWQRNAIATLGPFLDDLLVGPLPARASRLEDLFGERAVESAVRAALIWNRETADGATDAILLRRAAAAGMARTVARWLDHGPSAERAGDAGARVNAADPTTGMTPLLLAVSPAGSAEVVALLLEAGADPQQPDRGGRTPLHYAVAGGDREIAELLLQAASALASADESGSASPSGSSAGFAAVVRDAEGLTPLAVAARAGDPAMIDLLLGSIWHDGSGGLAVEGERGAGADLIGISDRFGRTALHHSVMSVRGDRAIEALDRLLIRVAPAIGREGAGADAAHSLVNRQDAIGDTALAVAAGLGRRQLVERLLQAGADPNVANAVGETAVHRAAACGRTGLPALMALLASGGDVHAVADDGRSAMDILTTIEPALVRELLHELAAARE